MSEFQNILLDLDEKKQNRKFEKVLKKYHIEFINKGNFQFKILNGCTPNIMLYPTKHKLMVQENGRQYMQTACSATLIAVIKGHVPFKKAGE